MKICNSWADKRPELKNDDQMSWEHSKTSKVCTAFYDKELTGFFLQIFRGLYFYDIKVIVSVLII